MKENDNEKSLMRKTKKELVDIILRKDDVEIRLKDTIKSKDEVITALTDKNVGLEAEVQRQEAEHNEDTHCIMENKKVLYSMRKRIRVWQIAFSVVTIVALVIIAALA